MSNSKDENKAIDETKISNKLHQLLEPASALIVFIPVALGFFFLAGTFYEKGYYRYLGINAEMFPLNFQEMVARGSFATATIGARIFVEPRLIIFIIPVVLLFVFAAPFFKGQIDESIRTDLLMRLRTQFASSIDKVNLEVLVPGDQMSKQSRKVGWALLFSILYTFILILLFAIAYTSYLNEGAEQAKNEIVALNESVKNNAVLSRADVNFIEDIEDDDKLLRQIIRCSENWCIFLKDGKIELIGVDQILLINVDRNFPDIDE